MHVLHLNIVSEVRDAESPCEQVFLQDISCTGTSFPDNQALLNQVTDGGRGAGYKLMIWQHRRQYSPLCCIFYAHNVPSDNFPR